MSNLKFATGRDFEQKRKGIERERCTLKRGVDAESRERTKARRSYNSGINAEAKKRKKIFANDMRHLYSTGQPFSGGR